MCPVCMPGCDLGQKLFLAEVVEHLMSSSVRLGSISCSLQVLGMH